MPYPTPQVGDAVAYLSNDGATPLPAEILSINMGTGVATLAVFNPNGSVQQYVLCPHDETRTHGGSWSWPTGSGAVTSLHNKQTGTSYTTLLTDRFLQFSNDAVRTVTVTVPPQGAEVTIMDISGSVTAGHTLTATAATGTLHGNGVITPGTNKNMVLYSDGTDLWLLWKQ